MAYNYVKFQRGTLRAYQNLRNKDNDTLYFIYADENNQYGSLYLGDKLISGGEVTVVSSALNDLTDVNLSNFADGQILSYNASAQKWQNLNLATAIQNANLNIQTEVSSITPSSGQTDEQALNTISSPKEGDVAFVGDNVYIYDGQNWQQVSAPPTDTSAIEADIAALQDAVGAPAEGQDPATGLYAELEDKVTESEVNDLIASAIGDLDSLKYRKVNSVADIDTDENQYIYLVPVDLNSNSNKYDEYLVVDGIPECIGHLGGEVASIADIDGLQAALDSKVGTLDFNTLETRVGNLEDIVNGIPAEGQQEAIPGLVSIVGDLVSDVNQLNTSVGDLTELIGYDSENPTTLVQEINFLKETVTWNDIAEE